MAATSDWNLKMVLAREALGLLPKTAHGTVDWGDIKVGHLDTGYTEHPIFGDWPGGGRWLRPESGRNLLESGALPLDPLNYEGNPGHGTSTCSLLCGDARHGDPGAETVVGVAPQLPVVPFRVVNSVVLIRERHRAAVAEGIALAVAAGCQVISISLGVPFFARSMTGGMGKAVDRAYEKGVIICAAGGQVIDRVTYPGKYNRTIGCGGLTWQRRVWWPYSEGAETIDVWAPAEGVLVADRFVAPGVQPLDPVEGDDPGSFASSIGSSSASSSSGLAGKIRKSDGTSYATAHVAAAAAMWLRLRGPEVAATYDEPWQRVEAFRALLKHRDAREINGQQPANGSRVLTIDRLLQAKLPAAATLSKAAVDKNKSF